MNTSGWRGAQLGAMYVLLHTLLIGSLLAAEPQGASAWLARIGSPDRTTSLTSAYDLDQVPRDSASVAALIAALRSRNVAVAMRATAALGELHAEPETTIPALIRQLEHGNRDVRLHAAVALSKFGELAVPQLIRCLPLTTRVVQGRTRLGLTFTHDFGTAQSVDATKPLGLIAAVAVGSPAHRAGVSQGDVLLSINACPVNTYGDLAVLLFPSARGPLVAQFQRDDSQYKVLLDREILPPRPSEAPAAFQERLSDYAALALQLTGRPAAKELLECLRRTDSRSVVQRYSYHILSEIGAESSDVLIAALNDRDTNIRDAAAAFLYRANSLSPAATAALVRATNDSKSKAQMAAITALSNKGVTSQDARLLGVRLSSLVPTTRERVITILGDYRGSDSRDVADVLTPQLASDAPAVKKAAAAALLNLITTGTCPPSVATDILDDEHAAGHAELQQALKGLDFFQMRGNNAAPLLVQLLQDKNEIARHDAIMALLDTGQSSRLSDADLIGALMDPKTWMQPRVSAYRSRDGVTKGYLNGWHIYSADEIRTSIIAEALGARHWENVDGLLAAIRSTNPKVRAGAAQAFAAMPAATRGLLAESRDEQLDSLTAMLVDEDLTARYWAAVAIGKLGPSEHSCERLCRATADTQPDMRIVVAQSLAASHELSQKSSQALLGLLSDAHDAVRVSAAEALLSHRQFIDRSCEILAETIERDGDGFAAWDAVEAARRIGVRSRVIQNALVDVLVRGSGPFARSNELEDGHLVNTLDDVNVAALLLNALKEVSRDDLQELCAVAASAGSATRACCAPVLADVYAISDERCRSAFKLLLHDSHATVRVAAARACASIERLPGIREALRQTLIDQSDAVRFAAASVISNSAVRIEHARELVCAGLYDEGVIDGASQVLEGQLEARNQVFAAGVGTVPWLWPPPGDFTCHALLKLDAARKIDSLGVAAGIIQEALLNAGFRDNGFFLAPAGFAVLTKPERVRDDGSSYSEESGLRWTIQKESPDTFSEYLKYLFFGKPGTHRMFAFFVTDQGDVDGGLKPDSAQAMSLYRRGARGLPDDVERQSYKGRVCHIVVYHFERKVGGAFQPCSDCPAGRGLAAEDHLVKAGIRF